MYLAASPFTSCSYNLSSLKFFLTNCFSEKELLQCWLFMLKVPLQQNFCKIQLSLYTLGHTAMYMLRICQKTFRLVSQLNVDSSDTHEKLHSVVLINKRKLFVMHAPAHILVTVRDNLGWVIPLFLHLRAQKSFSFNHCR